MKTSRHVMRRSLMSVMGAVGMLGGLMLTSAPPAHAIDELAPQVNFKGVTFIDGTLLSDSTSSPRVPARMVWSMYDPSGICFISAQLYDYESGSYTYPSVRVDRNFARVNVTPSHYYQLRLYLQDCAGNSSYYYDYPDVAPLYQETAAALSPGWTTSSCLCWSGGNVFWNTRTGAKASFTFTGQSVAWITDRASNRGTANVYLDGSFVKSVNLQGAGINRIVGFQKRFGSPGTHTLDIVVAGTPGHPRVDIDAFVVAN